MNTINDVSFGARLDYRMVTGNPVKWAKIAKEFELGTLKHPKDVFFLETNTKGGIYFYPKYNSKKLQNATKSYDKGEISPRTTVKLKMSSPEHIADTLKRLFAVRKQADNMLKDYFTFENRYNIIDNELADKFFMSFYKLRNSFTKNKIREDAVLKTLSGIEII